VRVGDVVLKRSIYKGVVRWAFPHRVAGEWDGRLGIYCGPGNRGKAIRGEDGSYLKRWITSAPPLRSSSASSTTPRAARVREEGERVVAERPWPTGWEDWRPPADWCPLPLPADWHVV
jgi:hypothetical protein